MKKIFRQIAGVLIIANGIVLSSYYVGISNPISIMEQLRAVIFLILSIASSAHYGGNIMFESADEEKFE